MLEPNNLRVLRLFLFIGTIAILNLMLLAQEKVLAEEFFNINERQTENLPIWGENTFLAFASPSNESQYIMRKMDVIVTAYSSTPEETDDDEFITASCNWVKDGIVANNLLSFA